MTANVVAANALRIACACYWQDDAHHLQQRIHLVATPEPADSMDSCRCFLCRRSPSRRAVSVSRPRAFAGQITAMSCDRLQGFALRTVASRATTTTRTGSAARLGGIGKRSARRAPARACALRARCASDVDVCARVHVSRARRRRAHVRSCLSPAFMTQLGQTCARSFRASCVINAQGAVWVDVVHGLHHVWLLYL